jgi:hypothetical protein
LRDLCSDKPGCARRYGPQRDPESHDAATDQRCNRSRCETLDHLPPTVSQILFIDGERLVIGRPLLGVLKELVRSDDLLELPLLGLVARIEVGVTGFGDFAKRRPDCVVTGLPRYAKNIVGRLYHRGTLLQCAAFPAMVPALHRSFVRIDFGRPAAVEQHGGQ